MKPTRFSKPVRGGIVGGYTYSNDGDITNNHGGFDAWVVKLDATGTIQWQKSLGGTLHDLASSVQQTSDGGFILAGYTESNDGDVTGHHGGGDFWTVKLDVTGNIQWQKALGGTLNDYAHSVQQTSDGGFIVAGWSVSNDYDVTGNHGGGSDFWTVKLDATGNIQWQKTLGGTSHEWAHSVQQTSDGGGIVAGYSTSNDFDVTNNHGGSDFWTVKLDATGNIQWEKALGGTAYDRARSVQQTSDGGFIVAGHSASNDGDITGNNGGADAWIVKLNASGTIQWQKALGGTSNDFAYSFRQTSDGGFIVAGYAGSNNGDLTVNHGYDDYWVVKIPGTGCAIPLYPHTTNIAATSARLNWTLVPGAASYKVQYRPTGSSSAWKTKKNISNSYVDINKLVPGTSYDWILRTKCSNNNFSDPTWTNTFTTATASARLTPATAFEASDLLTIYPNPASQSVNIEFGGYEGGAQLQVINVLGQRVISRSIDLRGEETYQLDISTLPDGVYTVILSNDEVLGKGRFIKE